MKKCNRIAPFLLCALLCLPYCMSGRAEAADEWLLHEICGPVYQGRGIGMEGNHLAERLLADRLETRALVPLKGYSDFLLPFEQEVATIGETMLVATMADGRQKKLVNGKDYKFVGTVSPIDGTYSVSLQIEKADAAAVLFVDMKTAENIPQDGSFAAVVYPVDTLHFNSLGTDKRRFGDNQGEKLPRIQMIRSVYEDIRDAVSLDIQYTFTQTIITAHNVVGVLPSKDSTRAVIVSAHLDGAGDQAGNRLPCALDNASGVAVVDLVLSHLAGTEPPYDVLFAFTNGEEAGLTGAHDFATRVTSLYEALYNINVDCVGIEGLPFPIQSSDEKSAALYAIMDTYLYRNGFVSTPESYGGGDHMAFEVAGIPSVVLGTPDTDIIHTANDIAAHIDPVIIRGVAEMIVDIIRENPNIHTVLAENRDTGTMKEDAPPLKYNEAVLLNDTLYLGSQRWMTYEEMLTYHPTIPIPQTYKGYSIEACQVSLSYFGLFEIEPGQIVTLPDSAENIMTIAAHYSDGMTGYNFVFIVGDVKDDYVREKIGDEGFLLKTIEADGDVIHGIGLQKSDAVLYLFDGDVSNHLLELDAKISIYAPLYGTSKATKENTSMLLSDPEFDGLFDAFVNFTKMNNAGI